MKSSDIIKLLPEVFQRSLQDDESAPLLAFLEVMDTLHAPVEALLQDLDAILDPRRTRRDMVPVLARWVDLAPDGATLGALPTAGEGLARELIAQMVSIAQTRGTAEALRRFLELATGFQGFQLLEGGELGDKDFHLLLLAPKASEVYRRLIEQIVREEKPAYVTAEIRFV